MVLTRRPGKECPPFVCNEVTRTGSYAYCGKFVFARRAWKRGSERRGTGPRGASQLDSAVGPYVRMASPQSTGVTSTA